MATICVMIETQKSRPRIIVADYDNPAHGEAIVTLLDAYACDLHGGGQPLTSSVRATLVEGLREHPGAFSLLAYVDDQAVGLANCFAGFSTFAARPLINLHDLAVLPSHRGRGVGKALLDAVSGRAKEQGCCKVTLEVRADNAIAQRLYRAAGFEHGQGQYLFWTKPL